VVYMFIVVALLASAACSGESTPSAKSDASFRPDSKSPGRDTNEIDDKKDLGEKDLGKNNDFGNPQNDAADMGATPDMGHDAAIAEDGGDSNDSGDVGEVKDSGMANDTGVLPGPVTPPARTPITLTSTYFRAEGNPTLGLSAWATASHPAAFPENVRSTIFWGRFLQNQCATPGYGPTLEHPLNISGMRVYKAMYPDCMGSYGPTVEAHVYKHGASQHLLRSEVRPTSAFQSFGSSGQNASGANAYIQAAYTDFSPSWRMSAPNRLKPWSGPSAPDKIRLAIRVKQSVNRDLLESPSSQQLQQVIRMLVINEACDIGQSSSFCQIELNFKTYNRGVGAYTSFSKGDVFNDAGQGGLIAVVGPIAANGQTTNILGQPAWTSWGSSTQLQPFQDKTFQIEITWDQFQALLMRVTNANPAAVFGNNWNNRQSWVLLRIGYGQENYNRSQSSSLIEGLFESVELFSL